MQGLFPLEEQKLLLELYHVGRESFFRISGSMLVRQICGCSLWCKNNR